MNSSASAAKPLHCRPLLCALAAMLVGGSAAAASPGAAAYASVDPFIGTGGDGHTFPGAIVPFGMIQLSPDTQMPRAQGRLRLGGGLSLRRSHHPRLLAHAFLRHRALGPGRRARHADRRRVRSSSAVRSDSPGSGYRSRFSHTSEVAEPGYYAVTLDRLRRARRAHRRRARRHAPLPLPGRRARARARSTCAPASTTTRARCCGRAYGCAPTARSRAFARRAAGPPGGSCTSRMRFSQADQCAPVQRHRERGALQGLPAAGRARAARRAQLEGRQLVGVFDFADAHGQPLLVKVAISSVSEDNALANLDARAPGWDFDAHARAARAAWEQALAAFEIEADAPDAAQRFYTALYHALHGAESVHGRGRRATAAPTTPCIRREASPLLDASRCGTPTAR